MTISNPNKFSIRCATSKDTPKLEEFEQGLIEAERPFSEHMKNEKFAYYDLPSLIDEDKAEILVVENNGELIACGYAKIRKSKQYVTHEEHGYIGFMYVDPEYRGLGVGQQLLDRLILWCKEKNLTEVQLDVFSENVGAIRVYEKAGFKPNILEMRLNVNDN